MKISFTSSRLIQTVWIWRPFWTSSPKRRGFPFEWMIPIWYWKKPRNLLILPPSLPAYHGSLQNRPLYSPTEKKWRLSCTEQHFTLPGSSPSVLPLKRSPRSNPYVDRSSMNLVRYDRFLLKWFLVSISQNCLKSFKSSSNSWYILFPSAMFLGLYSKNWSLRLVQPSRFQWGNSLPWTFQRDVLIPNIANIHQLKF